MEPEELSAYCDYWINVRDHHTGLEYSYGLTWEERKVLGTILCMENTWDPYDCEMSLIGADKDGNIYKLDDLTGLFTEELEKVQENES